MIKISEIKIAVNDNQDIKDLIIKKLKINSNDLLEFSILKKSIDARKKPNLYYVYEVLVKTTNDKKILDNKRITNISYYENKKVEFISTGNKSIKYRPIIVGSGPAGLFCAYILAKTGYKPLIIERGEQIEDRVKSVEKFFNEGILNENSNVSFGEGGAGTFSDGKLTTSVKDKDNLIRTVLEIFVENGADEEILYINKPHIGTDLLRQVIINIRNRIINWGGEFKYNTMMTNIVVNNNCVEAIEVNNKELIKTNILILAIGNSARETFYMLNNIGVNITNKPFAIGVRIQHPQELINLNQYGLKEHKELGSASYKLTYTTKDNKGIYSFCMCPGGYVINSSSKNNYLSINGMSNHKRDSGISNSAIVVTVNQNDYGDNPFSGLKYQEELEYKAYKVGNGKIPTQTYLDFKNNIKTKSIDETTIKFKGNYQLSNLREIFPEYINKALIEAIEYFSTKIKGFADDNVVLSAIETRTSSPIRILRDDTFESNIKGIYPIGEGSGYAGGITTCAVDGLKMAKLILKEYSKELKYDKNS